MGGCHSSSLMVVLIVGSLLLNVQSFILPCKRDESPVSVFDVQRINCPIYVQEGPSTRRKTIALHIAPVDEGDDTNDDDDDDVDDYGSGMYNEGGYNSGGGANPLDKETAEEKARRMQLVRRIQQTYYQTSSSSSRPDGSDIAIGTDGNNNDDEDVLFVRSSPKRDDENSSTIYRNVPLFRVQWTELPGYQNVLNIHVPHYTHMFRKILSSGTSDGGPPWRFGHLFLPGGSDNLSNPEYDLSEPSGKASRIGTLMQISDVLEREDGTLGMIVQAIDRFVVVESTQRAPYATATIRLLRDEEDMQQQQGAGKESPTTTAATAADDDDLEWAEFEVRPTKLSDRDEYGNVKVSPLFNFNSKYFPDELSLSNNFNKGGQDGESPSLARLRSMEYQVWVSIDELIRLLGQVTGLRVPVPSQMLGLLPPLCTTATTIAAWPDAFRLEQAAQELSQRNVEIGTGTRSPFVRVPESYPAVRRARRLSYVVWILLEAISSSTVPVDNGPTRQSILERPSVYERLSLAQDQLEQINQLLRGLAAR
jgi:Lon protease-like protein